MYFWLLIRPPRPSSTLPSMIRAEQAIQQAYRLDLDSTELLLQLAAALHSAGKWFDADTAARRALLYGAGAPAYKVLADALMEQHRYDDALAAYRAAIDDPSAAAAVVLHCKKQANHLLHFHLGRPEEAMD